MFVLWSDDPLGHPGPLFLSTSPGRFLPPPRDARYRYESDPHPSFPHQSTADDPGREHREPSVPGAGTHSGRLKPLRPGPFGRGGSERGGIGISERASRSPGRLSGTEGRWKVLSKHFPQSTCLDPHSGKYPLRHEGDPKQTRGLNRGRC